MSTLMKELKTEAFYTIYDLVDDYASDRSCV